MLDLTFNSNKDSQKNFSKSFCRIGLKLLSKLFFLTVVKALGTQAAIVRYSRIPQ